MMHLTFADKGLLVGDEVAKLVIEYTAALARTSDADTVEVVAYGADGGKVVATLLLEAGAPLMTETSPTDMQEPDNSEAVAYIRERMRRMDETPLAQPVGDGETLPVIDFEH